ncbi:MAG: hypothetical protein ACJ8HU_03910, partial [Chthoniobacterales bacterium]
MKNMSRLLFAALVCCAALALAQPPPPGEEGTPASKSAGGDVVDFKLLLPILPEPPDGWKAEEAEGSTDDLGTAQISSVHRDYTKDEIGDAPT